MAPRYWRNTAALEDPAIGVEAEDASHNLEHGQYRASVDDISVNPNLVGGLFDFSGIHIGRLANVPNSDLLNLCAPQPIEELIATHAAMTRRTADELGNEPQLFDTPGGTIGQE